MKVLVLNCGSSSLKYQIMEMDDESVLAKGLVERIGVDGKLTHEAAGKDKYVVETDIPNHDVAIKLVLDALVDADHGVLKSMDEIAAVGNRVLNAGSYYADSIKITPEVMETIKKCIDLAPLHMPANIMGIEACERIMPGIPQVAVFDTAFHQTMPKHAFLYALPYEYYEKYAIRRYGAHGTSHKYVAQRAAAMLDNPKANIITCHLGNGASMAAVKEGKVIDTSMGLTPLEGMIMGTRCGDIDPAIVPTIMEKENLTPKEMDTVMNKKSGMLGITGISSDFRDVENAANEGNERCQVALDMFAYRVRKYIGAYTAAMGGVDAIVFTAGLGENSITMRAKICEGLEFMGIKIDAEKNNIRGKEREINTDDAKVKVLLIPTNEELMIARDTKDLAFK
ncbi:MAG: acetate/propionate family kinase [bacterium]